MPPGRTCSECGDPIPSKSVRARTCSPACRQRRSRRLSRDQRERLKLEQDGLGVQAINEIVRREMPDEVKQAVQRSLEPVVREAITEDVFHAVRGMLNLTPAAVECLARDLESDDAVIRQRAYTLCIKYTIGHPALLRPENLDGANQLVVNFALPRPGDDEEPVDGSVEEPATDEAVTCDMCGATKPASEFVAGSERCQACLDEWKTRVLSEFDAVS